uniref:Uncharacterized protein n=1 Tax=Arundo donax TaxID=35708 RepID=A0A0A9FBA9_ARUDO
MHACKFCFFLWNLDLYLSY